MQERAATAGLRNALPLNRKARSTLRTPTMHVHRKSLQLRLQQRGLKHRTHI